jgi:hypothetical protein
MTESTGTLMVPMVFPPLPVQERAPPDPELPPVGAGVDAVTVWVTVVLWTTGATFFTRATVRTEETVRVTVCAAVWFVTVFACLFPAP